MKNEEEEKKGGKEVKEPSGRREVRAEGETRRIASEVKLNEQKEKKQAGESMEKLMKKEKRRNKGQTTLRGWLQGAKLDRQKTPKSPEKKGKESART